MNYYYDYKNVLLNLKNTVFDVLKLNYINSVDVKIFNRNIVKLYIDKILSNKNELENIVNKELEISIYSILKMKLGI